MPLALMVPTDPLPPVTVSTSQVTAVFPLPPTVAVNCCVCPVVRPVRFGLTLTDTLPVAGAVMVMVVAAVLVASATDAAVTASVAGDGTALGAV